MDERDRLPLLSSSSAVSVRGVLRLGKRPLQKVWWKLLIIAVGFLTFFISFIASLALRAYPVLVLSGFSLILAAFFALNIFFVEAKHPLAISIDSKTITLHYLLSRRDEVLSLDSVRALLFSHLFFSFLQKRIVALPLSIDIGQ